MCSSFSIALPLIFEVDPLDPVQSRVVRGDDPVAGHETAQDLELIAGTPAHFDAPALGGPTVGSDYEYPVPSGPLEKRSRCENVRRTVLTELQTASSRCPLDERCG